METEQGLAAVVAMFERVRARRNCIYVIGNGGSATIASHLAIDLVNACQIRSFTLHESSFLTCMANDYGYEQAFSRLLGQVAMPGDVLVAVSSSGRSPNIRNSVQRLAAAGDCEVLTLSGFAADNPLRATGDINIWLDSKDYGMVEVSHQFILHNVVDRLRTNMVKCVAP